MGWVLLHLALNRAHFGSEFSASESVNLQPRAASLPRDGPLRDNEEIWAARFLHAAIIWAEVDFIPQDYSLPPSASPRTHRGHVFVTHPEGRAALQRSRG